MSDPGPEVSVVIPTVGRTAMLERTLDAVLGQSLAPEAYEVIVVSDGDGPETEALVGRLKSAGGPRIRHLTRSAGPGSPGATRNVGWRAAAGALIAFTDDDCVPSRGWLEAGLAAAGEAEDSLVQGPTLPAPGDEHLRDPFSRIMLIEHLGPYFQTCNMFYPRALLERLEGFDETFERWGEDVDLGWRALEAGAGASWAPEALVHHAIVPEGPRKHLRFATREGGTVRLMSRHPSLRRQASYARVFVKRSHARLLLAALGLAMTRRFPPSALLTLPYLKGLRGRVGDLDGAPSLVPYLLLYDALELGVTVRAAARERVALL